MRPEETENIRQFRLKFLPPDNLVDIIVFLLQNVATLQFYKLVWSVVAVKRNTIRKQLNNWGGGGLSL